MTPARLIHSVPFWIVVLALAVVLTQAGGLMLEVWNWDESTFIVMASALQDGHLPYLTLFDNKPPLMFFTLAGVMELFGDSLVVVRTFGDITLFAGSVLVFGIARHLADTPSAGLAALLHVSLHSNSLGQFTSTELLALAFVLGAIWCLLFYRASFWAMAAAGFLISLATLTRTNLAFIAVMGGVYLTLAGLFFPASGFRRWAIIPYTLAGLLPLAVFVALYAAHGAIDTFWLSTVEVALHFSGEQQSLISGFSRHFAAWRQWILWDPEIFGIYTLFLLPGTVLLIWPSLVSGINALRAPRQDYLIVFLFGATSGFAILMTGPIYKQYWMQILPFMSIAAALGLRVLWVWRWSGLVASGLVVICFLGALRTTVPPLWHSLTRPGYLSEMQIVRHAAEQIVCRMGEERTVWAMRNHLILWYLDLLPLEPTIVHPDNLTRLHIRVPLEAAEYVSPNAAERLFESRPAFVVTGWFIEDIYYLDPERLSRFLEDGYDMVHHQVHPRASSEAITIYHRKDLAAEQQDRPSSCPVGADQ